jgi:thymidylate kinase
MENKGKLVNLLGINNLGKTTQVNRLKALIESLGKTCKVLKYPVYDLEPTGPRITLAVKKGNPENLSAHEIQVLNSQNKHDFEPTLQSLLSEYDFVIAEMYKGTSVAFGMGDGLDKEFLESLEKDLYPEDVSILLDGERFMEAKELGHRFEEDHEKMEKIRNIHLSLAKERGWKVVQANQPQDKVTNDIWEIIQASQ